MMRETMKRCRRIRDLLPAIRAYIRSRRQSFELVPLSFSRTDWVMVLSAGYNLRIKAKKFAGENRLF